MKQTADWTLSVQCRLRAGHAPLPSMLQIIPAQIGLGLDGNAMADDDDYFAEMRLALHIHRAPQIGASVSKPAEIFALATTGGARVLGQSNRLGQLRVGMAADLAVVDLGRMSWPYRAPEVDPVAFILQRAKAGDVTDVLVDGCHVLAEGEPTRFDWRALGNKLGNEFRATPLNAQGVSLVAQLNPFLEAWYGKKQREAYCSVEARVLNPRVRV